MVELLGACGQLADFFPDRQFVRGSCLEPDFHVAGFLPLAVRGLILPARGAEFRQLVDDAGLAVGKLEQLISLCFEQVVLFVFEQGHEGAHGVALTMQVGNECCQGGNRGVGHAGSGFVSADQVLYRLDQAICDHA